MQDVQVRVHLCADRVFRYPCFRSALKDSFCRLNWLLGVIFIYNRSMSRGHFHPISILTDDIARIFTDMGFDIEDGPEIETEY